MLEDDVLDTGEDLPINAFLSWSNQINNFRATKQTPQLAFYTLIWSSCLISYYSSLSFSLRILCAHSYSLHCPRFFNHCLVFLFYDCTWHDFQITTSFAPRVFIRFAFPFFDTAAVLEFSPITLVQWIFWASSCSNLDGSLELPIVSCFWHLMGVL